MESKQPEKGRSQIQSKDKKPIKKLYIFLGLGMTLVVALVFALWPRQINFSFSGDNCHNQISILPSLLSQKDNKQFKTSFEKRLHLFSYPVVSRSICVNPKVAPTEGETNLTILAFKFLPARQLRVNVHSEPKLNLSSLDKPIPASRPLAIAVSEPDKVFQYAVRIKQEKVDCDISGVKLVCGIEQLKLAQDKRYRLVIEKSFNHRAHSVLADKDIQTLKAVSVKSVSIKNKQMVFARPKHLDVSLSKPVDRAEARLIRVDKKQDISIKTKLDGKKLRIIFDKELPREASYRLDISDLEAVDGSGIDKKFTSSFKTSGGPKVASISIGQSGVVRGSTVYIQLDQPIKSGQDINKFVQVSGGVTAGISGKTVNFTLPEMSRCSSFTVKVKPGLVSIHGLKNKQSWSHSSRTRCYDTSIIGYSHRGQPISAYYFGNGSSNVLFTGAIHGDEASSSLMMQDLIQDLETNALNIPKHRQVVVVPTVNPDGLSSGTRNNARNVNLNRNFATANWKKDLNDTNGRVKGGGGKRPLSESESSALAALTSQLRPRLIMTYHAVGSFTMGNGAGDSASLAARYASMTGYRDATSIGNGIFDYEVTGAYEDWLAEKMGITNVMIELGSYTYHDFSHHKGAIWAMIKS